MTAAIRQYENIHYIRIDTLPDDEQEPRWIHRQTHPVIPDEFNGSEDLAPCAYAWDYTRWVAEGRPASFSDCFDT